MPDNTCRKVILIGQKGSGKTALRMRWIHKKYTDSFRPTLGVEFSTTTREETKYQLWDLSSMELNARPSRTKTWYTETKLFLLCVDLSAPIPLETLKRYLLDVREKGHKHTPILLVGTKVDLLDQEAHLDARQTVFTFCMENGISGYVDISAKEALGFPTLEEMIIKHSTPKPSPMDLIHIPEDLEPLYDKVWKENPTLSLKARTIHFLNDFAKSDNALFLFFTGHQRRNRVDTKALNEIVNKLKIDKTYTVLNALQDFSEVEIHEDELFSRFLYLKRALLIEDMDEAADIAPPMHAVECLNP